MATYAQLGIIADSQEFQQRVRYSACVMAAQVYSEGSGVAGHAARLAFALRVAQGNFNLQGVCYVILTNATIAAEATVPADGQPANGNSIPDAHIQTAMGQIWNALAGV